MMIKDKQKLEKVTEQLTEVNTEYGNLTAKCKALAEGRRNKSPVRQELLPLYMQKCEEYTEQCRRQGKPLTFAGYALACGFSLDTFNRIRAGQYDYVTEEYRILHNLPQDAEEHTTEEGILPLIAYSDAFKNCELLIQEQLETNCYTNRGNPAGSIFALKARYQWSDETTPHTVNQSLVIADANQARKVLDLLK